MPKENNQKIDIEIYLTEYRALREEQKTRLTINSTILNVMMLVVAGVLAAYVQMSKDTTNAFNFIMLVAPIITSPLVLFYYDNQFMVYRIGQYFSEILYQKVRKTTKDDAFGWEAFHQSTSGQLWLVALGRNFLLVLVSSGPILAFLLFKQQMIMEQFLALHPLIACELIRQNTTLLEKMLLLVDLILLVAVLISWGQSGRSFSKITSQSK